ncbi:hypothetical protein R3W88_000829 [Solanum pinnatisectum]|uniref:DUF7745 domain-containing protein n=1 Tax=Solanum pinnatisectum TaxID=50273 RepID=A0AAV9MIJ5_9SOLN|nr:hypothetical protein R3W88_000829 [Solanum pinnatisectum]
MGNYEQSRVKKHLGHIVHLRVIDPRRDVIEALIPFRNPKNNVFRFSDFEMTPTLKEVVSFMRKGPIIPKNVVAKKFLYLLKINQIEKESLKNGRVSVDFLYERCEAWTVNGCFVFMVAILGFIIFPKRDKHIDIRLAGVVKALNTMENPTIIPMILTDILCALTKCKKGEKYFEGSNILL